jgi:hypothetical protein
LRQTLFTDVLVWNNTRNDVLQIDKLNEEVCMKKIIAILLISVMTLSLAACADNQGNEDNYIKPVDLPKFDYCWLYYYGGSSTLLTLKLYNNTLDWYAIL